MLCHAKACVPSILGCVVEESKNGREVYFLHIARQGVIIAALGPVARVSRGFAKSSSRQGQPSDTRVDDTVVSRHSNGRICEPAPSMARRPYAFLRPPNAMPASGRTSQARHVVETTERSHPGQMTVGRPATVDDGALALQIQHVRIDQQNWREV